MWQAMHSTHTAQNKEFKSIKLKNNNNNEKTWTEMLSFNREEKKKDDLSVHLQIKSSLDRLENPTTTKIGKITINY